MLFWLVLSNHKRPVTAKTRVSQFRTQQNILKVDIKSKIFRFNKSIGFKPILKRKRSIKRVTRSDCIPSTHIPKFKSSNKGLKVYNPIV